MLNEIYWVDGYPDIDDDDNKVFPAEVVDNQLVYLYSGQQFADVIYNVREQKKDASLCDYINALNYYNKYDNFIDF